MSEIIFVGIVSAFCFGLLALLMRAFAMDAWEARRVGYMRKQQRLVMPRTEKEQQKALVIEIASRRLEPVSRDSYDYSRTA
ncbi:MAG TPA: hypothetical protein VIJ97_02925 [Candidatus Anoxymicrobiaceae bacterium]